jgi:hypothetical protein
MFKIEYQFTDNQSGIKNIDDLALRYELFLGSLTFEKGDKKIAMNWKWIPLVDFVICMQYVCSQLNDLETGDNVFEFTESDATITFHKEGNQLKINPSFSDVSLTMNFTEFHAAVMIFSKNVIVDIFATNKELQDNKEFKEIADSILTFIR